MMKTTLKVTALLILFSNIHPAFAQTNYLPGYIIDLSDQKVEGYINYQNWDESPKKITFKKSLTNPKVEYSPANISQFGVEDEIYLSAEVEIEVSPNKTDQLEYESALELETKQVFLQTIVAGEKSLYHYKHTDGKDNFYILRDNSFQLLSYKRYLKMEAAGRRIAENKNFIGQLGFYLQDCPSVQRKLSGQDYTKQDLEKIFVHYYSCTQAEPEFQKKIEKSKPKFGAIVGISLSTLKFINGQNVTSINAGIHKADFSQSLDLSGGLFLDIILPRSRNKWSSYNELLYTSYKVDGLYEEINGPEYYTNTYTTFQYTYIKLNNFLRYRYPIGNSRILFNVGISNGLAIQAENSRTKDRVIGNSTFTDEDTPIPDSRVYERGLLAGLGFQMANFSIELRHERGNAMSNVPGLGSRSKRNYILLGYRF